MADLKVRVVSPDETVWKGDAASVTVPAWDGRVGVLPGHAPFIALLGHGELIVDLPGGGSERSYVAGGVAKVEDDEVVVLTEYAGEGPPEEMPEGAIIHPEEVDVPESFTASSGNPLV